MKLPYAEDVNYWKTGKSAPDSWIDKARREIIAAGGVIFRYAFGSEMSGSAAFMMEFSLGGDNFRVIWPVLPSRAKNEYAAKVQAATMMYHDIKSKCMVAKVLGARAAFFSYLVLPDGRNITQASMPEIESFVPRLLLPGP